LSQEVWEIGEADTTGTLFAKTGERGGPLLLATVRWLRDTTIVPIPQNHSEATYTKYIEKKDGELQHEWTVDEAYHRWQAYTPWPGIFSFYRDIKVSLLKIKKIKNEMCPSSSGDWVQAKRHEWRPGDPVKLSTQVVHKKSPIWTIIDNLPAIQLSDWIIVIEKIHPAGKKPMSGEEFVRGYMI
jgi:methionyl-tRNA formyltransferase